MSRYLLPKSAYWLNNSSSTIFKIGINPIVFGENIMEQTIYHVYLDPKIKRKKIYENTYIGCLLNNNYQAIHIHSPVKGKILDINHNLSYQVFKIKDLLELHSWLFSIKII